MKTLPTQPLHSVPSAVGMGWTGQGAWATGLREQAAAVKWSFWKAELGHCAISALLHAQRWQDQLHVLQPRLPSVSGLGGDPPGLDRIPCQAESSPWAIICPPLPYSMPSPWKSGAIKLQPLAEQFVGTKPLFNLLWTLLFLSPSLCLTSLNSWTVHRT